MKMKKQERLIGFLLFADFFTSPCFLPTAT